MQKHKNYYVYTHAKPNGLIFYVGKGNDARIKHIDRKTNTYHTRIVAKYGKENIIVKTMLCRSEQHALDLEVRMIAALRNGGVKLVNLTDGGEGVSGFIHSEETRKKRSIASKNRIVSDETKRKISESKKNISPETRRKISESKKRLSEEVKQKLSMRLSEYNKTKVVSDETRKKISDSHKGKKLSDETKKKIGEYSKNMTEEKRKAMSDSVKKSWEKRKRVKMESVKQINLGIYYECFI